MLEHTDRIRFQIAHINRLRLFARDRMLVDHRPAQMTEPEAQVRVVRIGIGVAVLVVQPVHQRPVIARILAGNRLQTDEKRPQRCGRLVRLVAEEAMAAHRDAEGA